MNNHFGKWCKYSWVIKKQEMNLKVNATMHTLYGTSVLANISFNLVYIYQSTCSAPLKSVILTCTTNLRQLRVPRWKQKRKTRSVDVHAATIRSPDKSLRKLEKCLSALVIPAKWGSRTHIGHLQCGNRGRLKLRWNVNIKMDLNHNFFKRLSTLEAKQAFRRFKTLPLIMRLALN